MIENVRKAAIFVALTYFLSYTLANLYFALGGQMGSPEALVMTLVYMFIPMGSAIVVQKLIYKQPVIGPLGISFRFNRWFLIAWLVPPVIAFITLGVSLLFPGIVYTPDMAGMYERFQGLLTPEQIEAMKLQSAEMPLHPIWLGLLQGLIAGITVNAVAGFGEELGWRGLLHRELGYLGFWRSSAVIGLIWGLWHAPIILQGYNYPQHPLAGVGMMTGFTILLSPIFNYIRLKSGSVVAAAILHGSLNGTFGLAVILIKGGDDLTVGVTGLAGLIALAMANVGLLLFDRIWAKHPITMD